MGDSETFSGSTLAKQTRNKALIWNNVLWADIPGIDEAQRCASNRTFSTDMV